MRSIKLSVTVAASIATLSLAGSAFADPPAATSTTTSTTTTAPAAMPAAQPAPVSMTPAPAVVPNADGSMPATTSTTTTTSADTDAAAARTSSPDQVIYDKHTPSKAWLITGGALLVGTYATTAAVTAANGNVGDHDLYIPVAGPWIDLASRQWSNTKNIDTVLIFGSGVLQGVGAGMAVASFFIPEKTAVATIHAKAGPVDMLISPTAGGGMGGVGAVGTF